MALDEAWHLIAAEDATTECLAEHEEECDGFWVDQSLPLSSVASTASSREKGEGRKVSQTDDLLLLDPLCTALHGHLLASKHDEASSRHTIEWRARYITGEKATVTLRTRTPFHGKLLTSKHDQAKSIRMSFGTDNPVEKRL